MNMNSRFLNMKDICRKQHGNRSKNELVYLFFIYCFDIINSVYQPKLVKKVTRIVF